MKAESLYSLLGPEVTTLRKFSIITPHIFGVMHKQNVCLSLRQFSMTSILLRICVQLPGRHTCFLSTTERISDLRRIELRNPPPLTKEIPWFNITNTNQDLMANWCLLRGTTNKQEVPQYFGSVPAGVILASLAYRHQQKTTLCSASFCGVCTGIFLFFFIFTK